MWLVRLAPTRLTQEKVWRILSARSSAIVRIRFIGEKLLGWFGVQLSCENVFVFAYFVLVHMC